MPGRRPFSWPSPSRFSWCSAGIGLPPWRNTYLLFYCFALAYFRLYAIVVVVALKFWAQPLHAELNGAPLDDLPSALAVYLLAWLLIGYLHYRKKSRR